MKVLILFFSLWGIVHGGIDADTSKMSDKQLMEHVMSLYKWEDIWNSFGATTPYFQTENPDMIRFKYYYNKRSATERAYIDVHSNKSIKGQPWKLDAPFKILIHGFTQRENTSMPAIVKNAYMERMRVGEDVNVIVVNWGHLSGLPDASVGASYPTVVRKLQIVGERVGLFIHKLKELGVMQDFKKVHLIGFSLGAHVAGWASDFVKRNNNREKPGRITGLDPAGPGFDSFLGRWNPWRFVPRQLSKDDADFVDVIHTSYGAYGVSQNLGHVDFYINPMFMWAMGYVQIQPRCLRFAMTKKPWWVCSHNMAPVFFAMSIHRELQACKRGFLGTSASFWAYERNECRFETVPFGEHINVNMHEGEYYTAVPRRLDEQIEDWKMNTASSFASIFREAGLLQQSSNAVNSSVHDPEVQKIWEDKNDFVGVKLKVENNLQLEGITALRTKAEGYFMATGEKESIGKTVTVLVPQQRKSDFMLNVAVLEFTHVSHFLFETV